MLHRFLFTVLLCVGVPSVAGAQLAEQTGLVGTVRDTGGGVIPGASVSAVNVETQDTYETVTNEQGQYNIPNVRIGRYCSRSRSRDSRHFGRPASRSRATRSCVVTRFSK